jgi:hypothetical protein
MLSRRRMSTHDQSCHAGSVTYAYICRCGWPIGKVRSYFDRTLRRNECVIDLLIGPQEKHRTADNINMNISGVSSDMVSSLASQATNLQANNLGLQFSTAVMKEIMDSQKVEGNLLVKMIDGSLDGTGKVVDVGA